MAATVDGTSAGMTPDNMFWSFASPLVELPRGFLMGAIVALLMGRLFWPKNRFERMQILHKQLTKLLHKRIQAHSLSLQGEGTPPPKIQPADITKQLLELQRLINVELSLGPHHVQRIDRDRWRQCLSLWRCQQVRWLLVERLIERLHKEHESLG